MNIHNDFQVYSAKSHYFLFRVFQHVEEQLGLIQAVKKCKNDTKKAQSHDDGLN